MSVEPELLLSDPPQISVGNPEAIQILEKISGLETWGRKTWESASTDWLAGSLTVFLIMSFPFQISGWLYGGWRWCNAKLTSDRASLHCPLEQIFCLESPG